MDIASTDELLTTTRSVRPTNEVPHVDEPLLLLLPLSMLPLLLRELRSRADRLPLWHLVPMQ